MAFHPVPDDLNKDNRHHARITHVGLQVAALHIHQCRTRHVPNSDDDGHKQCNMDRVLKQYHDEGHLKTPETSFLPNGQSACK